MASLVENGSVVLEKKNCLKVANVLIAFNYHWPFISTNLNSLYPTRKKTKIGSVSKNVHSYMPEIGVRSPVGTVGLIPLTFEHKAYAKTTQRTTKFSGLASSSAPKKSYRKFSKTKWKRINNGNM